MSENSASGLDMPGAISDPLTELLRRGARGLIEKAVEAELQLLLEQYGNATDLSGRKAVVRDRSGSGVKLNSALVPPYVRKARRVEAALPWLYCGAFRRATCRRPCRCCWARTPRGFRPRW